MFSRDKRKDDMQRDDWLNFNLEVLVSAIEKTDGALSSPEIKKIYNRANIMRRQQSIVDLLANTQLRSDDVILSGQCTATDLMRLLQTHDVSSYVSYRKSNESFRYRKFKLNAQFAAASSFYLGLALFVLLAFSWLVLSIIGMALHNPVAFLAVSKVILTAEFYSMIGVFAATALSLPVSFLMNKGAQKYNNSSINSLEAKYNADVTESSDPKALDELKTKIAFYYADVKKAKQPQQSNSYA